MPRASVVGIDLGSWKCRATTLRESNHSMNSVSVDALVAEGPGGSLVAGPAAFMSAGVETIRLQPARLSGRLETRLGERLVDNREVAVALMRHLLDMTEAKLGERPSAAVLALPLSPAALPASFLAELSQLVELEVIRVIAPATAATVALGWESSEDEGEVHLALLDIGHGKTSAASAELGDGIVEMIGATVDKTLGGSRWDQRIVELLERRIVRPGFQYFGDHEAVLGRLSAMAVEAKHALSAAPSTAVQARTVGRVGDDYVDLDTSLTRVDVEQATTDLTARLSSILSSAARDLLSSEGLDRVIVTGGGANWPPNIEGLRRNLGDGVSVIVRSPDLVARGAALHAGMLTGAITDLLLLDVTHERLSVVDPRGQTAIEIAAGTTIPTRTTAPLGQHRAEHVDLRVLEGGSPEPEENRLLGVIGYTTEGEVEAVVDIDANGEVGLRIIDPGRGSPVAQWSSGGEADRAQHQPGSDTQDRAVATVFISYAREDEAFIAQVRDVLTQAGVPVWVDTMIEAGANWDLVIEDELARCKVLIVILSPASVGSRHVRNELSVALGDEKTVIPVLYRECRVPWNLRLVQHVDFTDSENTAFDQLLQVVKASL